MILPSKHLSSERALLTVSARLLAALDEPRTVSALWDTIRKRRDVRSSRGPISYEWFVLSLDLLHAMNAIELENGLIRKSQP
jgi:hypothetical protein